MKWFKHDTDCSLSEGLSYLIDQEGFAGYGRWFRLLEIVASKMDGSDRCYAEYSTNKWCSLLGLKQKKLKTFLKLTENKLKTKVFCFDNIVRIEIPNLLNKRDEYLRKSGVCQDKVAQEVRSKNKDKRIKNKDKENIKKKKTKTDIAEDFGISERVKEWADKKGFGNLDDHLENFISTCKSNGYAYIDWDEAFMRAIRDDWAKIRTKVVKKQSGLTHAGIQAFVEEK